MKTRDARAYLLKAQKAIEVAIKATEENVGSTEDSQNITIKTTDGEITIIKDGKIVINPDKFMQKSFKDSRDFSVLASQAGEQCSACNGTGRAR